MAQLDQLSDTSWRQPFIDRTKEFELWNSNVAVAKHCDLQDGTKRLLRIQFEPPSNLDITDYFQITSKEEYYFPKDLQRLVRPIILANPGSSFTVTVLDTEPIDGLQDADPTTGSATIKTRVGQNKFRSKLIDYWYRCAVTGLDVIEILRSSHIKPWSKSSDSERLDCYNGLLLSPMYDSLFDKGLISFSDSGDIIIAANIIDHIPALGISDKDRLSKVDNRHKKYLNYHRENVFQK